MVAGCLTQNARCQKCKSSKVISIVSAVSYTETRCKVCDSLNWDYTGVPAYVTDQEIGVSCLNHHGSGFLSVLWLLAIAAVTITDCVLIVKRYQSDDYDLVHVLAWMGMKLILFIAPFTCLISAVHHAWPEVLPGIWTVAIDIKFLIQRLRFLNMRGKHFAGYAICVGCIILIVVDCAKYAAPFFDPDLVTQLALNSTAMGIDSTLPMNYFIAVEGIFNFGGMCYVVYLLRCSYEAEVLLVIIFLKRNIDDLDICRARLAEAFDSFHRFREFASGWFAMLLLTSTVCVLLELHVWITATVSLVPFQYERILLLLMFVVTPVMALGNVDIDYIWNRLLRRVSRERTQKQEIAWDKVMQFLNEQRAGNRPWQAVLAFFISTIALFSAIQFRLWNGAGSKSIDVYQIHNGTRVLVQQLQGVGNF